MCAKKYTPACLNSQPASTTMQLKQYLMERFWQKTVENWELQYHPYLKVTHYPRFQTFYCRKGVKPSSIYSIFLCSKHSSIHSIDTVNSSVSCSKSYSKLHGPDRSLTCNFESNFAFITQLKVLRKKSSKREGMIVCYKCLTNADLSMLQTHNAGKTAKWVRRTFSICTYFIFTLQ